MSPTLITNIQTCIQSNSPFGFYYSINDDQHQIESTEVKNKLLVCYPLLIDDATLIAIFSNTELDIVKTMINKDFNTIQFNPSKERETTTVYSFDLDKIIEFTDYGENSWDKYSNCEGCRYGYSNQQGHMGFGGCIKEY